MTEKEIVQAELESVEKIREEIKTQLEEFTQHLGKMNTLSNIFSSYLKQEDSSES